MNGPTRAITGVPRSSPGREMDSRRTQPSGLRSREPARVVSPDGLEPSASCSRSCRDRHQLRGATSSRRKAATVLVAAAVACATAAASWADSIKITVPKNYATSGTLILSGRTSGTGRVADLYADAQPCASTDEAEGRHHDTTWWGNLAKGHVHGTFSVLASFPYPTSLRASHFYFCAYVMESNNGVLTTFAHTSLAYAGGA